MSGNELRATVECRRFGLLRRWLSIPLYAAAFLCEALAAVIHPNPFDN